MAVPLPTPILRLVHIDNLGLLIWRGALHAPNHSPNDGLKYRIIHNEEIQSKRRVRRIPCGPGGVIHDYVAFYFGQLSPMMFQLKTGWVPGYTEGQEPLIYLSSTAQSVADAGLPFVFSNGHGIMTLTGWFDALAELENVDWSIVYERYWKDDPENDPDRQRRKQAEFLVHHQCPWSVVEEIVVMSEAMRRRVLGILGGFPSELRRDVRVRPDWYY
jgi:hypothetical protein